jgi:hypothetical protein
MPTPAASVTGGTRRPAKKRSNITKGNEPMGRPGISVKESVDLVMVAAKAFWSVLVTESGDNTLDVPFGSLAPQTQALYLKGAEAAIEALRKATGPQ